MQQPLKRKEGLTIGHDQDISIKHPKFYLNKTITKKTIYITY